MHYQIRFHGRTKGAIGICYMIVKTVEAENKDQAILKLYETHENVGFPEVTQLENGSDDLTRG